jgi:hypothetical protein
MDATPVFDSFWRFAAERQAIYFRRLAHRPAPWTTDPILGTYRFTNAYRAADRVSQYLIRDVQYDDGRLTSPVEVFFRTMLFKLFNKIETWQRLEGAMGPISWRRSDLNTIGALLDELMVRGARIYSPAYIMPAPPFGHSRKHLNHLALLKSMIEDRVPDRICRARGLGDVYEILRSYPGIGPFLAYQFTIDLNYSPIINHDESSFVIAGPGALDGISKCFSSIGRLSAEDVILWTFERQEREFSEVGIRFQSLFGRRLQPIDCQNLYCEISKYARVAHPDVHGQSSRRRIKQIYRHDDTPLPPPFFPPKWGLSVHSDAPGSC